MLDNCEHLLDEVPAFVDELLSAGSKARVLATSPGASLDVPGEQSHRVPSLDERASLVLLLARATEASDSFRLDADEEATALELCRRLDGIPLASGASQLRSSHISRRPSCYDASTTAFGSSSAGLDVTCSAIKLFKRSSNGAGTFSTQTNAASSCRSRCSSAVGRSTRAEGSLGTTLGRTDRGRSCVPSFQSRWSNRDAWLEARADRMLETVRLFAEHKLVEMGLAEGVRVADRDWFVQWVEAIPLEQRLWSLPWIQSCADDLDNVAAAFEWSLDHDELTQSATLLVSTARNSAHVHRVGAGLSVGEDAAGSRGRPEGPRRGADRRSRRRGLGWRTIGPWRSGEPRPKGSSAGPHQRSRAFSFSGRCQYRNGPSSRTRRVLLLDAAEEAARAHWLRAGDRLHRRVAPARRAMHASRPRSSIPASLHRVLRWLGRTRVGQRLPNAATLQAAAPGRLGRSRTPAPQGAQPVRGIPRTRLEHSPCAWRWRVTVCMPWSRPGPCSIVPINEATSTGTWRWL